MHQVERQRVRPEFEGNHSKIIIIIDIPGSVLLCPGNLKEKRWGREGEVRLLKVLLHVFMNIACSISWLL